jgi:adenylyl-sulfate kinase
MNLDIFKHDSTITNSDREKLLGQNSIVIWLTGLSGSGKSTIANEIAIELHKMGKLTYILDGDNIRLGLNKDLTFSDIDRKENIRRISETAKLMSDAGVIVITAFISPFINERDMAKNIIGEDKFFEIFVNTPIEVCENRDPKGLYNKARKGEIKMFTGIDSPYENPISPYMTLLTENDNPNLLANNVINQLISDGNLISTIKEVDNLDKKKTLAIDFDGVIHRYSKGFKGVDNIYDLPMEGTYEALTELKNRGYILKILSSRPKEFILKWLKENDLDEFITEVSNHKFPASLYIDDRGFNFKNWSQCLTNIKTYIK